MKKLLVASLILAAGVFAWLSLPAPPRRELAGGHAGHAGDSQALADGVVVAVDAPVGRNTISHGPLYSVGMPPMTMGFNVSDPALLAAVRPGDQVRFHVDVIGGAFTVVRLEAVNDPAELRGYAAEPAYDLSERFLAQAAQRGDCCVGVFAGERLVSYSFNARRPTFGRLYFEPAFRFAIAGKGAKRRLLADAPGAADPAERMLYLRPPGSDETFAVIKLERA